MKNEEAIDVLNNTAWLGTDVGIKVYPAVRLASEALEKQIRYAWHDLRKKPKDLPEPYKDVLFACDNKRYRFGWFDKDGGFCSFDNIPEYPVAWRYIEPFEEVG